MYEIPIGALFAIDAMKEARSALPDAPVLPADDTHAPGRLRQAGARFRRHVAGLLGAGRPRTA
jgi:hypothetical protein